MDAKTAQEQEFEKFHEEFKKDHPKKNGSSESGQPVIKSAVVSDYDRLVEVGRGYAPEFISILGGHLHSTVYAWLEKNHAPAELIRAVDVDYMMRQYETEVFGSALTDMDARELVSMVPEATELIAKLGGVFHDGENTTYPRKDVLTWPRE